MSIDSGMTVAEANSFLTRLLIPTRELHGEEYNQVRTILLLLDPVSECNNQYCMTDVYELAGNCYYVTYFPECSDKVGENPVIEIKL